MAWVGLGEVCLSYSKVCSDSSIACAPVLQPIFTKATHWVRVVYSRLMERSSKLRRLNDFRRSLPHLSAASLSAVLAGVSKEGLPQTFTRAALRAGRNEQTSILTPYGLLHQTVQLDPAEADGSPVSLQVAHPLAMLHHAYATCAPFRQLIKRKLAEWPCSAEQPWSLILYSDEVVPGNVLAPMPSRKCQVVYYSFQELGLETLSREDGWFCATVKRSRLVNQVAGGMAQVIGALLKLLFTPGGHHLSETGILLTGGDDPPVRLFAKLKVLIQDGAAHKQTWHCRGDGATVFCSLCLGLVTASSQLQAFDRTGLLCANVIRDSDLTFATSEQMKTAARRIQELHGRLRADQFVRSQQASGFTFQPYSLLCDLELDAVIDPASQFMHDWMHGVLNNGVFNTVLHMLVEAFFQHNRFIYDTLVEYLKQWRWPHRLGSTYKIHEVFDKKRRKGNVEAGYTRCQASEALSIYPVVACFVRCVARPAGTCTDQCEAFLALTDVIAMLQSLPHGCTSAAMVRNAVHRFLALLVIGFDCDIWPKAHWMLHYAAHIEKHKCLYTCFVHERKHRVVRRFGNDTTNQNFDHAVLGEVTCHHLARLRSIDTFDVEVGLVGGRPASAKAAATMRDIFGTGHNVELSHTSRHSKWETSSRKDAVILRIDGNDLSAGEVWAHVAIDGVPMSIICTWTLRTVDYAIGIAEWSLADRAQVFRTEDIWCTCIWTQVREGVVRTLLPRHVVPQ